MKKGPHTMKAALTLIALGLTALSASAEKSDATKAAVIAYTSILASDQQGASTLLGEVVVTKGTLVLKAERARLRQAPHAYLEVTFNAGSQAATFRQKRDGGPGRWVEGEAERIEYDERTGTLTLYGAARLRQLDGERVTGDIRSELIAYDSLRDVVAAGNSEAGGGTITIPPRKVAGQG
jgi:lipopolysaccharide export system protein LptA